MTRGRHGNFVMSDEDSWFVEALYQQAANAVIRLTAMTEKIHFADKPRKVSVEFVLKVIESIANQKMEKLNTETVKIGKRYYVEIIGDEVFSQQPLVPFKGFYRWLKANGIHTSNDPVKVTLGDLYAVAVERKAKKRGLLEEER